MKKPIKKKQVETVELKNDIFNHLTNAHKLICELQTLHGSTNQYYMRDVVRKAIELTRHLTTLYSE